MSNSGSICNLFGVLKTEVAGEFDSANNPAFGFVESDTGTQIILYANELTDPCHRCPAKVECSKLAA